MKTSLKSNLGKLDIYDYYVVAVANEGVLIKQEHNNFLVEIAKEYFKNTYFGYISYRKNSYSVDPKIYLKTSEIENLVGLAIITTNKVPQNNVTVERLFLTKPMETFRTIKEAKIWIDSLIKNISKHP